MMSRGALHADSGTEGSCHSSVSQSITWAPTRATSFPVLRDGTNITQLKQGYINPELIRCPLHSISTEMLHIVQLRLRIVGLSTLIWSIPEMHIWLHLAMYCRVVHSVAAERTYGSSHQGIVQDGS